MCHQHLTLPNNKVVIAYRDDSGKIIVGDVNPNTNDITFGTKPVVFESYTNYYMYSLTYNSNYGKVIAVFIAKW